jgi:hypothetical protein
VSPRKKGNENSTTHLWQDIIDDKNHGSYFRRIKILRKSVHGSHTKGRTHTGGTGKEKET